MHKKHIVDLSAVALATAGKDVFKRVVRLPDDRFCAFYERRVQKI